MNVLLVSGIWPPDVGGPASHAPDLAEYLVKRGHIVEAVVTADARPARRSYPVRYVSRRFSRGVRHLAVAALVARRARASDVVYATSMLARASLGALVARRPLVVKVTTDEAYERARRLGLVGGDLDAFQHQEGGIRIRLLRSVRTRSLRRAAHVLCPSLYLRDLVIDWGVSVDRVEVVPNPAPSVPELRSRAELREELDLSGHVLGFAGRLTSAKALEVALRALAETPSVSLAIAGDGSEREELERLSGALGLDGRVVFLGARSRHGVLELFRAVDAALLSSRWENFPHSVVEALAVGTPVIATAVGGVPEVVRDGENGLLVPSGDARALAAAIRRFFADESLRQRLAGAARASVASLTRESALSRIEQILVQAAAGR